MNNYFLKLNIYFYYLFINKYFYIRNKENCFQELTAFCLAAELHHVRIDCFLFYIYLCHNSKTDFANCKTQNQCNNIFQMNSKMYTLKFLNICLLMISCSFYAFLLIYREFSTNVFHIFNVLQCQLLLLHMKC